MNRRLWLTVGAIVALFGGVSFIYGGTGPAALPTWTTSLARSAAARLERLPWTVVAGIAVAAVILAGLAWWIERRRRLGHGEPWRTVVLLGKQGRSISVIARNTGLPQDAVRIVLAPVSVDPSFPRGNSFRSSAPARPDSPASDQSKRRP